MVENRRICCDLVINSRPVKKFKGKKVYVSTGDSDDMGNGELVDFYNKPSRANVEAKINDVIFAKMSKTDKTFLIDEQLSKNIYSTGFFNVSSKKIYSKFLYYLIKSYEFDFYKNAYSEGTTQISISDKRLRLIKLTYETNYVKQIKICNKIDGQIISINALIKVINSQIENLSKYRKVLIENCIKKGLDCKKLINSDVNWIGNINARFKCLKIKYVLKNVNAICCGPFGSSLTGKVNDYGDVKIYGQWNLISHNIDEGSNYISEKDARALSNYKVENGDFLLSMMGTIGKCMKITGINKTGIMDSHIIKIKLNTNIIDERFFEYQYDNGNCDIVMNSFETMKKGSIMDGLNTTIVKNSYVILPPLNEQKQIISFLDERCRIIEKLIDIKGKKIDELKKLKESLIYEYISGKKEVL